MSSTGGASVLFWCHQCNATVTVSPSPSGDVLCTNCQGGFVEEMESAPNPNPIPHNPFAGSPFLSTAGIGGDGNFPFGGSLAGFPLVFSSSGNIDLSRDLQPRASPSLSDFDVFNPFQFLQNHLHNLMAGGANIQFVIENHSGEGAGIRLPANLGDYFIGPGLEQLIQQLAENDPNRHGTPPASKSAIEALPDVTISEKLIGTDLAQCAVCKDEFEVGSGAKQMPCKHIYHSDCILPWLEMHNSCPVCRYELPTDDHDYEQQNGGGRSVTAAGVQSQPSTPGRRFRISLPFSWPFGATRSQAGDISGGGRNRDDAENSNRDTRDMNSETRQEDLD